ncbi:hypothetical protein Tco_1121312 [Tanacetum coccineum]|uniref:Uncharacterized protein n=1 Tax=Tanacetum coccineum TaxID=301880 RepID=A0ABQ5IXC9_9ASTR
MLLVNNESILVNLVLVDCAKTCACNDSTVVSEPKVQNLGKTNQERRFARLQEVDSTLIRKIKRHQGYAGQGIRLTQTDEEAVKESEKEYIGMVKICYEGAQRSKQERPGEDVVGNSRGTAWIKEPQAFAKISVEVGDALDGTPRKKSRTARDLVLIMLLVNNESILVNLVLVDCAKTCACNDFTVVSEPKKDQKTPRVRWPRNTVKTLLGLHNATTKGRKRQRCRRTLWDCWNAAQRKKRKTLTQTDEEAVKESEKEYIGMVKICYEGAQRSKQERPGEDVVGNSRGTAWIKEPQAFAKISVEVGDALDGTPRKKSRTASDLVLVWKATWKRQPRRTRGELEEQDLNN